jgi:hypothetical protein
MVKNGSSDTYVPYVIILRMWQRGAFKGRCIRYTALWAGVNAAACGVAFYMSAIPGGPYGTRVPYPVFLLECVLALAAMSVCVLYYGAGFLIVGATMTAVITVASRAGTRGPLTT